MGHIDYLELEIEINKLIKRLGEDVIWRWRNNCAPQSYNTFYDLFCWLVFGELEDAADINYKVYDPSHLELYLGENDILEALRQILIKYKNRKGN